MRDRLLGAFAGMALGLAVALATTSIARGADHGDRGYRLLRLDGHHVKWGEPGMATGATVTYGFVARPMHFADARNCRSMVSVNGLLSGSAIEPAAFRREVAAAFATWAAAADLTFRLNDDPQTAMILIGAQAIPRDHAYADVAYGASAGPGVKTIERSLICLNPAKPWKPAFGDDGAAHDARYTVAHEIGHAIGLDHPGPSGQLMSFRYDERFRELQDGDIAGAIALYGEKAPERLVSSTAAAAE